MCAIAGVWRFEGQVEIAGFMPFLNSMKHRGPDGFGVYQDRSEKGLIFGHRRLAILDLTEAGSQPMTDPDGRYTIIYNGEIYNYQEIKEELIKNGYIFTSDTDTEVILGAYRCWGEECQKRFNGMWSFAIWDKIKRSVFLSRDRFGVKPLFYIHNRGLFAVASELKAFLHLPGWEVAHDHNSLRKVLADVSSTEGGEASLLKGVRRLLPGHSLNVTRNDIKISRWWNTLEHLHQVPTGEQRQAEKFFELFEDACRIRRRSDVPFTSCLSGGVDSSSIVAMLSNLGSASHGDPLEALYRSPFVATFEGTDQDETRFAREVLDRAHKKGAFVAQDPGAGMENIEQVVYGFEEIYSTMPTSIWSIYQSIASSGLKVTLDGHGADELLAGYMHYPQEELRNSGSFLRHPYRSFDLLRTLRGFYSRRAGPVPGYLQLAMKFDPTLKRLARLKTGSAGGGGFSSASFLRPIGNSDSVAISEMILQDCVRLTELSPMNRRLYIDFHHTLLPTILRNFDRCSMAHGVEVRMPFMDWRLVTYAFSLPASQKVNSGLTKYILRRAMRDIVPASVLARRDKVGFASPLLKWFNCELKDWIHATVTERSFLENDIWDGASIRDYVIQKSKEGWKKGEPEKIWPYLHAHLWMHLFVSKV